MKKSELQAKAKTLLYSQAINQPFTEESEIKFLCDLFSNHQHWELKKGNGVRSIHVAFTPYKTRCFYITRFDGSVTDISYVQCLKASPTDLQNIKSACRDTIRPMIQAFRGNVEFGKDVCPITGEVLTKENTHIDHFNKTFDEVFNDWMKGKSISVLATKLNNTEEDLQTRIYFTDEDIRADFYNYHYYNTHLRAVSRTANLSVLK